MKVPFLDLKAPNEPIRDELLAAIAEAVDNTDFVLGPRLKSFERAFATYCECDHAIGVNSGTDALFLIMKALGIGEGDEVITAPNVFIAAVETIAQTGARPVLADVSEDNYCIDPERVEQVMTDKTRAIVPVHLFGQPCDMALILDLAASRGIPVIEDACQAHGARYHGRRVGSLGAAAAFSFYPTKNLSAFGDGGAVTTNDPDLADRITRLRHHAQGTKNTHDEVGYNSRLDSIQAAVLEAKLAHLDDWNKTRQELAERVRSGVSSGEMVFPTMVPDTVSVYHILAVRHSNRQLVHDALDRAGIGWGGHIAAPIHLQPGYRFLGYKPGDFPVTEHLAKELVSLPIYPTLTQEQADYVAQTLDKVGVSV